MKNLILYGPPGTGKTRRLLKYIDEFMKDQPGRVLFCSHTRAAAQEAISRWSDNLFSARIDIQTLHSVCFKALKLSKAQTVDFDKLTAFGHEFGIDMTDDGLGKEFNDVLSLARAKCITPDEGYERSWRPGTASHFSAFAQSYQQWKNAYGYMDFNDMLDFGAARITCPMVNYALVVIDEAQDLTPLHWKVIYRMVKLLPRVRFLIAGDDDQALYSFAGADPAGMPDFGNRTDAESQVLSQSYRITQQVYDVARAIIARVRARVPKDYAPRTGLDGRPAQGKYEVWPNMDYLQIDPTRDSLLLYADRFVRGEVEPLLQENGINYKALNGYPSPLDSRAGRALKVIHTHTDDEILDYDSDLRPQVRGGLSARGQGAWDNVSEHEVLARIRRHDWSVLAIKPQNIDYLRSVNYSKPQNLRISTMHGAKGLQGDDVHLILSLSPRAWAEAAVEPDHLHRLLYTAVTRTRENLYLYDGENGYELPSEFR
jgi:DNA helicase-2/ATP-dependent DNA helicase PcrA